MRRTIPWFCALGLAALSGCVSAAPKAADKPPQALGVAAPEAAPRVNASELVGLDAAAANQFVKSGEASEIVVRLRVRAEAVKNAPRPNINLGLVVDTSGSMAGKAIEDARAASLALLDALSPGDNLAVVSFNSTTEVLVPSTRLSKESIGHIREQIGSMKARGTTDMAGGLRAGLAEVTKGFRANGVNRVVLLGDGVPNSEAEILPLARDAGQRSVSITMLGLGLDYNETLMNDAALASGGSYHFIKESSAVASVFKEEVLRLKQVVGRGAVLSLSPGPGVSVKSVVGLPSQAVGVSTQVTLGDLSEGDQRDVIVRLAATGRKAGSVVELLDAVLSFDGPSPGMGRLEERGFLSVTASDDKAELASGRDIEVERSAARVGVADMIVRAIATARAGNLQEAQAILDGAEKEANRAAKALEDPELQEKAKSMGPLRASLPSLVRQQQAAIGFSAPSLAPEAMTAAMQAPAAVVMDSHKDAVRTIQGM